MNVSLRFILKNVLPDVCRTSAGHPVGYEQEAQWSAAQSYAYTCFMIREELHAGRSDQPLGASASCCLLLDNVLR